MIMHMHDDDRAFFLALFERVEGRIAHIEERLDDLSRPPKRGKVWWKTVGIAALCAAAGVLATRAANHVGYVDVPQGRQ